MTSYWPIIGQRFKILELIRRRLNVLCNLRRSAEPIAQRFTKEIAKRVSLLQQEIQYLQGIQASYKSERRPEKKIVIDKRFARP